MPYRPRGCVARIGEKRQALSGALLVEPGQAFLRQVGLTPYFKFCRRAGGHRQRDTFNSPQILCDVFSLVPVAACSPGYQGPVVVGKRHRQAVDLEFADKVDSLSRDQAAYALVPGVDVLIAESIGQAEQGTWMDNGTERAERFCADTLCGRIGRDQIGMRLLEFFQLEQEGIVLRVAYLGTVEHVVTVIMIVDLLPERGNPFLNDFNFRHQTTSGSIKLGRL